MIIHPCDCGGLPYVGLINRGYDTYYAVYCMLCGEVSSVEWTDDEAIENWNSVNTLYLNKVKWIIN